MPYHFSHQIIIFLIFFDAFILNFIILYNIIYLFYKTNKYKGDYIMVIEELEVQLESGQETCYDF